MILFFTRLFAGVAFAAALAVSTPGYAGVISDFAIDFSGSSNPSGNWSYGFVNVLGGAPTLASQITNYGPTNEVVAWSPAGTFWPTIALNTSASPVSFGAGNAVTLAGGQGLLHPGASGAYADVRFVVPFSLTGILDVSFQGVDAVGTTTDVHVLKNGSSLFSGLINGYGQVQFFSLSGSFLAGDYFDLAVGIGSNGNYFDDSTGLYATLRSSDVTAVPEPLTLGLFGAGLAGVVGVRRRRRS